MVFEFQSPNHYDDYFFADPLVPYRVTVVAVNLAGPGEQEMKDFFTREGGIIPTAQGLCCLLYCCHIFVHHTFLGQILRYMCK